MMSPWSVVAQHPALPSLSMRPAEPPMPAKTLLGTVIGGVKVHTLIAESKMSEIYRATDMFSGMERILKICRPQFDRGDRDRSRFNREIALHSKVVSRFVPRICSAGRHLGDKFLIMEYVSGQDLATLLTGFMEEQAAMALDDIVNIGVDVASAMRDIGFAGLVHRDLKPSNIIIAEDGHGMVIDFGIATTVSHEDFTDEHLILGTPGYMSPEQWAGQAVDQRSDIYSFGIVLFEMTAGIHAMQRVDLNFAVHPDFSCDNMLLRRLRPDVPEALNTIITDCLRRDRRLRYHSFESIIRDLLRLLQDPEAAEAERRHGSALLAFLKLYVTEFMITAVLILVIILYLIRG